PLEEEWAREVRDSGKLAIATHWTFKYFYAPEEIGFLCMMMGWALVYNCAYNMNIAFLFIVCMIPFHFIENLPLQQLKAERAHLI
ncbi:phospholipid methyltransferase, partial [Kipferlia bialata]